MSTPPLSEALRQLLQGLPATLPPERIDHVWLFAPREIGGRENGLVVLSLRAPEPGGEQRQVVTLRYEAERARGGIRRHDVLTEQGWAPAERIPRLIEGVLRRSGEEPREPTSHSIRGDPTRWAGFLAEVGAAPVDPGNGE